MSAEPEIAGAPREYHGYGCPHDGEELLAECEHCCRHGWVESMQGKPCPHCVNAMPAIEQGDVLVYLDETLSLNSSPTFCFHLHRRDGGPPPPGLDKVVAIYRQPLWRKL